MPRIAGKNYTKPVKAKAPARKKAVPKKTAPRKRVARAPKKTIGERAGGYLEKIALNLLGKVTGLGDYKMNRNSLLTDEVQVPFMHSAKDGVRLRHREFIADVSSSTSFVNQTYSVNPGLSDSFPWLAAIAQNFEEYSFEGLIFEFKTTSSDALTSTNTALGTLIMAAEYNTTQPAYINKQQMENAMWAVSSKPSCSVIMPVECAPALNPLANQYVRTAAVPSGQDIRMYDLCNVQVATVGSQATAVIGELWASYDIVLRKPQLSSGLNFSGQSAHYQLNAPSVTAPLGTTQTDKFDSIGLTIVDSALNSQIQFPLGSQGNYLISYDVQGTGPQGLVSPVFSLTGSSSPAVWNLDTANGNSDNGATGTVYIRNTIVNIPDPTTQAIFTVSTGGTFAANPTAGDLFITQLNGNLNS